MLGPEFPFALLVRTSGENEETLAEVVDRLVGRGLLFERPGEILQFPEDRLRQEAYDFLPERRRRLLHRRAGEALEAMGDTDVSLVFALARHFYLGHEGRKSVHYNRIAAELAEGALAPDAAWEHFTRALESQRETTPEDLDEESSLVLEVARITEELGLLQEADAILGDFLDREQNDPRLTPGRRATLELFLARVRIDQGDNPAAAELAKKVLGSPGLDEQLLVRVGAHRQLGMTLYYAGHYAEALAQHTEEIRLARETGNELVVARAQVWRVGNLAMLGQTEAAIAEARESTGGSRSAGLPSRIGHGAPLPGRHPGRRPIPTGAAQGGDGPGTRRRSSSPRRRRTRGGSAGRCTRPPNSCSRPGLEEGAEKGERSGEIFRQIGDRVGLSMSLKVRGQIAMAQGRTDLAEEHLLEAYRLLQGLKHTLEEIDVVLRLAQLSQVRGETATAKGYVDELGRLGLLTLRPDLAAEFERLQRALAPGAPVPTGEGAGHGRADRSRTTGRTGGA